MSGSGGGGRYVLLHYPRVGARNGELLREAARRRSVVLDTWLPHLVQVSCGDSGAQAHYDGRACRPAVILHRTIAPFSGLMVPALALWARTGAVVLNDPRAAYRTRDKLATTLALVEHGVPVVDTLGFVRPLTVSPPGFGAGRVVVKPAHGLRGQGVRVLSGVDDPALWAVPDNADRRGRRVREHFLLQPMVESGGRDLRAYVVGGRCVALMQRYARTGEIRANLAQGASASALPLRHPAVAVAVAAAGACGIDYGGVDLIEDGAGVVRVLEVDTWAGFAGITEVTGADVAGGIIELARARHEAG